MSSSNLSEGSDIINPIENSNLIMGAKKSRYNSDRKLPWEKNLDSTSNTWKRWAHWGSKAPSSFCREPQGGEAPAQGTRHNKKHSARDELSVCKESDFSHGNKASESPGFYRPDSCIFLSGQRKSSPWMVKGPEASVIFRCSNWLINM